MPIHNWSIRNWSIRNWSIRNWSIRNRSRRSMRLALPLAGAALALAACGSSGTSAATTGGQAKVGSGSNSSAGLTVTTRKGADGTYLTDSKGMTLYLWVADGMNSSTCSGSCASAWPPATTGGKPVAAGAAKSADLGTIKRSDGTEQVTYDGHPLYYFAGDSGPGKITGQGSDGFGAKWWLVAPSGSAITKAPAAPGKSHNSKSHNEKSGSGSGYGGYNY
jgi:predicted lipoprotein with Yx(FWY)xxD motif